MMRDFLLNNKMRFKDFFPLYIRENVNLDKTYLVAIKQGDMRAVQRMVDKAAKVAGYDVKAYHGTNAEGITAFKKRGVATNFNNAQRILGYFFTSDPNYAAQYGKNVITVFLQGNFSEESGSAMERIENGGDSNAKKWKKRRVVKGFTGAKFASFSEEIVVFSSKQIKSADPVTYDDEGNIIPLSKRFDNSKDDIRY
jgi:hypothetical protein